MKFRVAGYSSYILVLKNTALILTASSSGTSVAFLTHLAHYHLNIHCHNSQKNKTPFLL